MKTFFLLFALLCLLLFCDINLYAQDFKDFKNAKNAIPKIEFLSGDINLLSSQAPQSIQKISTQIYNQTGFRIFVRVIKNVDSSFIDSSLANESTESTDGGKEAKIRSSQTQSLRYNQKGDIDSKALESPLHLTKEYMIKNHENAFISQISQSSGDYAVIFLFYDDSYIDVKSNAEFINAKELLDEYAYPYLPLEKVGSAKYSEGVDSGLSNLYLALSHVVAYHYKMELKAPKPLEKPSDMTKVVIYVMLAVMLALFVLFSNGLFVGKGKKQDLGRKD